MRVFTLHPVSSSAPAVLYALLSSFWINRIPLFRSLSLFYFSVSVSLVFVVCLYSYAGLQGIKGEAAEIRIRKFIDAVGLQRQEHQPAGTLSGGQKRKLSVGLAFIGDAKIIFLYETIVFVLLDHDSRLSILMLSVIFFSFLFLFCFALLLLLLLLLLCFWFSFFHCSFQRLYPLVFLSPWLIWISYALQRWAHIRYVSTWKEAENK